MPEPIDDSATAAEYVLGLLSPTQRALAERRSETDTAFAAQVGFWQQHFSELDHEFAEQPVSPAVLARLEHRLFGRTETRWWDSLALWRSLAGAAVAVAVIAVGSTLLRPVNEVPLGPATQLVAAVEQEGSAVSFILLYDGQSGQLRLTSLAGEVVPERDYELWAIQGEDAPISMGVVPVNERMQMRVEPALGAQLGAETTFAVTLEPLGGSPTGGPTGPVVASGQPRPI